MIKKLLLLIITITLTSCASMPSLERKACTDEKAKTLTDLICKK